MKKLKIVLPIFLVVCVVVCAGLFMNISAKADDTEEGVIAQNVYIGEVNVGGMTADDATAAVNNYVAALGDTPFTVTTGDSSVTATASQLGLAWGNEEIVEEAVNLGKTGNLIARYKAQKDLENESKVYNITYKADETTVRDRKSVV